MKIEERELDGDNAILSPQLYGTLALDDERVQIYLCVYYIASLSLTVFNSFLLVTFAHSSFIC